MATSIVQHLHEQYMTNEDNNHDTKFTNKNDTTTTTRAICTSEHGTWSALFSRLSCLFDDVSWSSWLKSFKCPSLHLHVIHDVRFSLTSSSSLSTSTCPSPSSSTPLSWCTTDLHTDLDNLDSVENNLRHSAKGSLDAYDVAFSLTGYEPNDTVSNELVDSQGPFSYITPSSDQDIDDTTLGKLLTEAHREYADYRSPEGVFVSQSSLSVASDRTGKPVGESNLDQFSFGVRNTHSAHNHFPAITQAEKMVDRTVKPVGESSSSAQIRTLFDEQRQMIIAEYCEKVSHHELQAAWAEQKRQILQEELWHQQKDFRGVHQQNLTENYENSRVLPSIRSQEGSSSRTRTLLWNYLEDYKICKMK